MSDTKRCDIFEDIKKALEFMNTIKTPDIILMHPDNACEFEQKKN